MDRTSFGIWSWGSRVEMGFWGSQTGIVVLGFWDGDVVLGDLQLERDSGISNGDVVLGSGTGMLFWDIGWACGFWGDLVWGCGFGDLEWG